LKNVLKQTLFTILVRPFISRIGAGASLKLSDAEERLHLLGESTNVSGSHEHSPVSFQSEPFAKEKLLRQRPIPGEHF